MGLVEEREVAHVMDEDVAQDGQVRVDRSNLAEFGLEGCTEAVEGRGGVQLVDFADDLAADQLTL